MIRALGILLVCQLIGEVAARGLALPAPGPVIGLVLLLCVLLLLSRLGRLSPATIDASDLGRTAAGLLAILGILFVPAGVGVIDQIDLVARHGVGLIVALVVSTVLTLVATVWTFVLVRRWMDRASS